MNKAFWKNKKVLITGHEGFLGTNLTKTLLAAGAKIAGLDIYTKRSQTLFSNEDYKHFQTIKGSVADYAKLAKIFNTYKPEIVFHLAAEAIVSDCTNNPIKAFKSNIEGTWNILEISRNNPFVKAIVMASSDKAYGSHRKLPYKEDAALKGTHPYDVSKSCADLIAYTYYNTYRTPVAVTRCGNIFGPGDYNFSRIVPDAVRCALKGKPLLVRSDGKFTRDYVFVQDIVNGYILLAEKLQKLKLGGEAFNFSDENPITVIKLLEVLYKFLGLRAEYKILNKAKYEIKHQYLASNKARKVLGWKPSYTLTEGVKQTIAWYKQELS